MALNHITILLYEHESVNKFLNNAILQDAIYLVSVLQDFFRIICSMACIFEIFKLYCWLQQWLTV